MNFLPGKLVSADAASAELDVCGQRVRATVDARRLQPGAPVRVGVRPEHLLMGNGGDGAAVPATLRHTERLGDASLLYLDIPGNTSMFTMRVEGSVIHAPGTQLQVRLLSDQLHVFDDKDMACDRTVELPV